MTRSIILFLFLLLLSAVGPVWAGEKAAASLQGNTTNESFELSKRRLYQEVYRDAPRTWYCGFPFDAGERDVRLPRNWHTPLYRERARRVEIEHAVPAENFGRFFAAWREGDPQCLDGGGMYKGRRCAEKADKMFRFMYADLHNLFPVSGAVNAMRSNYRYVDMPGTKIAPAFGGCDMRIVRAKRIAEPPDAAKGQAARATLYMAAAYAGHFRLSLAQDRLMRAWNRKYPVTREECVRSARKEKIQGNANPFVKEPCEEKGWYDAEAEL